MEMKNIIVVIGILLSISASAQKYFTKAGLTSFEASVEAFEPVEAKNISTTAILNGENGEIAVLLFVKAFHFEIALMEEHFNENYMDSDKFPKSTFKGRILDFDINNLTKESKKFDFEGEMLIRGIGKEILDFIYIRKIGDKIYANGEFQLDPNDFEIKIPSVVRNKIANSIKIIFEYELSVKS